MTEVQIEILWLNKAFYFILVLFFVFFFVKFLILLNA